MTAALSVTGTGAIRSVIGEPEALFDGGAHPLGELARVLGVGARQQHGDRILGVARDPVVLAEVLPHQDAEPLEDLVADAVAVLLVDRRQAIDVEQDQREREAEPRRRARAPSRARRRTAAAYRASSACR